MIVGLLLTSGVCERGGVPSIIKSLGMGWLTAGGAQLLCHNASFLFGRAGKFFLERPLQNAKPGLSDSTGSTREAGFTGPKRPQQAVTGASTLIVLAQGPGVRDGQNWSSFIVRTKQDTAAVKELCRKQIYFPFEQNDICC